MRLYDDKDLTHEITVLDLGEGMAGEKKEYKFYLRNDSTAFMRDLELSIEHKEVKIEHPPNVGANDVIEFKVIWEPSVTIKQGLKAKLRIQGIEVYRP